MSLQAVDSKKLLVKLVGTDVGLDQQQFPNAHAIASSSYLVLVSVFFEGSSIGRSQFSKLI